MRICSGRAFDGRHSLILDITAWGVGWRLVLFRDTQGCGFIPVFTMMELQRPQGFFNLMSPSAATSHTRCFSMLTATLNVKSHDISSLHV